MPCPQGIAYNRARGLYLIEAKWLTKDNLDSTPRLSRTEHFCLHSMLASAFSVCFHFTAAGIRLSFTFAYFQTLFTSCLQLVCRGLCLTCYVTLGPVLLFEILPQGQTFFWRLLNLMQYPAFLCAHTDL